MENAPSDPVSWVIRSRVPPEKIKLSQGSLGRYVEIYDSQAYVAYVRFEDLLMTLSRVLASTHLVHTATLCRLPGSFELEDYPQTTVAISASFVDLKIALSTFDMYLKGEEFAPKSVPRQKSDPWSGESRYGTLRELAVEFDLELSRYNDGVSAHYLGLEVARQMNGSDSIMVGSSERDRQARELMFVDGYDVVEELDRALCFIKEVRRSASFHPLATAARDRWLRSLVVKTPELVDAQEVNPFELGSIDDVSPRCYAYATYRNGNRSLLCFTKGPDVVAPLEAQVVLAYLKRSFVTTPSVDNVVFVFQRRDVTKAFESIVSRSREPFEVVETSERWFDI